ncbi:esterase-like activity of phytase family protein [Maribacter sp. 4U21]|uniref:esterase-like activity of phytase family protein n=1 Tax=Maribacter sp. 4U21 TaxID=1889779 RepID=UPI0015D4F99F|nr:esterase-like activity of phytase family protein [Maribacter sp. 4U21]
MQISSTYLIAITLAQTFFMGSCTQEENITEGQVLTTERSTEDNEAQHQSSTVRFIDEFVLPDGQEFGNTIVGGLSGIDYENGKWVVISDDSKRPRYYTLNVAYDIDGFSSLEITGVITLKDSLGRDFGVETVDSESIRIDGDKFVWSSEGNIGAKINPFVRTSSLEGDFIKAMDLPLKYSASNEEENGPRQNGVFEGLSLSSDKKGYWVSMELPLKEDGEPPTTNHGAPIRLAYIDKVTGEFGKEFAYPLDPVARPAINGFSFELNGLVELLEYEENKFLALERSFSAGYTDGGNTVKIYDVDARVATDVSGIATLKEADITMVKKKLLLDFDTLRPQLTNGIVDNIEGITFGPNFSNGNKSIVVVSDNNFSRLYKQLNQFILLELRE